MQMNINEWENSTIWFWFAIMWPDTFFYVCIMSLEDTANIENFEQFTNYWM